MNRNQFLAGMGLASAGLIIAPNTILGQTRPSAYQKDVVRKFVGAAHTDLGKVKELLDEYPNLIYSSDDWGGGDFETGIGAGGHMGFNEMVNFLISKGARPTLHVMTMLGKTNLVIPVLEEYPQLINSLGPHGLTFLHHAKKGGENAKELLAYFEEKGQTETQIKLY